MRTRFALCCVIGSIEGGGKNRPESDRPTDADPPAARARALPLSLRPRRFLMR